MTEKKKAPGTGPVKLRNINVPLTPDEISEYRRQACDLAQQVFALEEKRRIQNQGLNLELKEMKAEHKALIARTTNGREDREIECYEEKDLDKGMLYIKRADTHEVIDSRRLKPTELQADLPMEDPDSMRSTKAPASPALGGASKAKAPKAANVPPPIPMTAATKAH